MKLLESLRSSYVLQLIHCVIDPVDYMETKAAKHGDVFTVILGKQVIVHHPEAIKSIFTSKCLNAPGDINDVFRFALGNNSIFVQSGAHHKRSRQLLMPPFHGERLESHGEFMCEITKKTMDQWQIGQPFNIDVFVRNITMSIILNVVFGLSEGERYQKLKKLLFTYRKMVISTQGALLVYFPILRTDWLSWSLAGRIQQILSQIDELIYAEISDRRREPDPERTDILSLLMSARDEEGEAMTDVELRDQMIALIIAGHETTATTLTWAFYWIHKYPEVKQKLLQELDNLPENAQRMNIFRLPYFSAVCNETLRISPANMIVFPRVVQSSVEIMGHQFQPGAEILGSIYLTHQREDLYPEPKKFKPERFLERQFSPYEFIPFGGGERCCIGATLAMYEIKLILATILSQVDLVLVDHKPVKIKRQGVLLGPDRSIPMVMTGKRKSGGLSSFAVSHESV